MSPKPTTRDLVHGIGDVAVAALSFYLFRHFKTRIYLDTAAHRYLATALLDRHACMNHTRGAERYGSKICRFGKDAVIALCTFLLLRAVRSLFFPSAARGKDGLGPMFRVLSRAVLAVAAGLSLALNLNAFVYLLPYFAWETWRMWSSS